MSLVGQTFNNTLFLTLQCLCFQSFDAVGWVTERTSDRAKLLFQNQSRLVFGISNFN